MTSHLSNLLPSRGTSFFLLTHLLKPWPAAMGAEHPARSPCFFLVLGFQSLRPSTLVLAGNGPGKAWPPWKPAPSPVFVGRLVFPIIFRYPNAKKKTPNEEHPPPPPFSEQPPRSLFLVALHTNHRHHHIDRPAVVTWVGGTRATRYSSGGACYPHAVMCGRLCVLVTSGDRSGVVVGKVKRKERNPSLSAARATHAPPLLVGFGGG